MTAPYDLDYLDLKRAVAGLAVAPAELHGSLCGFLCAGGEPQPGRWLSQICIDPEGLTEPAERDLESLRRSTLALLDDPELRFTPLLPEDDAGMGERVQALGDWCAGFIGGFGLTGAAEREQLSAEASDALRDLDRIAHFGYEAGESEEDESAYAEILEFVRVAVLLLRQEAANAAPPPGATRH